MAGEVVEETEFNDASSLGGNSNNLTNNNGTDVAQIPAQAVAEAAAAEQPELPQQHQHPDLSANADSSSSEQSPTPPPNNGRSSDWSPTATAVMHPSNANAASKPDPPTQRTLIINEHHKGKEFYEVTEIATVKPPGSPTQLLPGMRVGVLYDNPKLYFRGIITDVWGGPF